MLGGEESVKASSSQLPSSHPIVPEIPSERIFSLVCLEEGSYLAHGFSLSISTQMISHFQGNLPLEESSFGGAL